MIGLLGSPTKPYESGWAAASLRSFAIVALGLVSAMVATAFALPGDNCVDVYANDLGFLAVIEGEEIVGFNVLTGGGMGMTPVKKTTFPAVAKRLAFIRPDQVLGVAEAIVKVQRDFGRRDDRSQARMKYLINDWGLERFKAKVEEYYGKPLAEPHPTDVTEVDDHLGWHEQGDGKLFLGIDHTAIVVADTEASLGFYRDVLGLKVAGSSENYGPEQERLNNVFGARLRITSLRAASGPGIEFLEYLAPRDGRPYPADGKPNDLIHWQTRLPVNSLEQAAGFLKKSRSVFVSSGIVELPEGKALTVRDPDGHAVQIVQH